ncbi:MAG: FHA domain-containing protein [Sideroxyarcus sp.]
MRAPFFVEVLARNGEVRHRHRVDALPIRIGRGYDNDYILDDRHTSAHHVIVEPNEDGALEVRDQGSRNGVFYKGKRHDRLTIDGNTIFRLGHTNLRIRPANFSVADEMRDTTIHSWEGLRPALTGLVLMVLVSLSTTWLSDFENADPVHYVTTLAGLLGVGLLWCGGWTLANRLFAGQTRFGRHFFIAASGLAASELVSFVLSFASYAFSLDTLSRFGIHAELAVFAGMVFFHLVTINPNNMRRLAFAAVLLLVLGSGVTLLFNFQKHGQLANEYYMNDLFSPAWRVSANKSVEQFIAGSRQLKLIVDADRSKDIRAEGEEDDED